MKRNEDHFNKIVTDNLMLTNLSDQLNRMNSEFNLSEHDCNALKPHDIVASGIIMVKTLDIQIMLEIQCAGDILSI